MSDTAFNGMVRKDNLYRFRRANYPVYEYVMAQSLTAAAAILADVQINPDQLQYEGQLITPLRRDVV